MNIEIANRLVNLRKSNNLSQEALAEKLGISRQAVSKWERAEASPDTDNLILLARLYHVSLDELLRTEDEIPMPKEESDSPKEIPMLEAETSAAENIPDRESESSAKDDTLSAGIDGFAGTWGSKEPDGFPEENMEEEGGFSYYIPMPLIITIIYFIIGVMYGAWHPGWMLFLLVPIWTTLVSAIRRKNANYFAYPVLAALIYLCLGFFSFAWHPGWIIFLTVPLYYSVVSYIHSIKRGHKKRERDSFYM